MDETNEEKKEEKKEETVSKDNFIAKAFTSAIFKRRTSTNPVPTNDAELNSTH
jgi:hypothetical protein